MMKQTYWINARDKPAFLLSLMRTLQGDNAQIAFEGDFSNCDFSEIEKLEPTGNGRNGSNLSMKATGNSPVAL